MTDMNSRALAIASCLLMIYGAKCWIIASYGSDTPFGDQWSAEADLLFRPYLNGSLSFSQLFAHHNEHRIFFARLFALAELWANGTWSPLLQMLVNALIHVLTVAVLVAVVASLLQTGALLAFLLFATTVMVLPFGWENTLGGFQLQFYLVILLALLSLFLLHDARAWSLRWCLGGLVGILSYFAMASGAMTLAAFAALALAHLIVGRRAGVGEWTGLACVVAVAAIMILDVPVPVTGTGAQSIAEFLKAAAKGASWPIAAHNWTVGPQTIGALFLQAPLVLLAVRLLRQRPDTADRRWFLLALGFWIGLQIVALAHGRSTGMGASRYLDLFVFGLLINAACAFVLVRENRHNARSQFLATGALGCWLIAVLYGGGQKALSLLPDQLAEYAAMENIRTDNLKAYLASGDISHLRNKSLFHVPTPVTDNLIALFGEPRLRAVLPPSLFGRIEATPRRDTVLKIGPMLIPIGLALFALALFTAAQQRREDTSPNT